MHVLISKHSAFMSRAKSEFMCLRLYGVNVT